jgi:hypothetical protein
VKRVPGGIRWNGSVDVRKEEILLRKREESRNTWKRWRVATRQTIGYYCLDDAVDGVSQVARAHGGMASRCPKSKNVEVVLVGGFRCEEYVRSIGHQTSAL